MESEYWNREEEKEEDDVGDRKTNSDSISSDSQGVIWCAIHFIWYPEHQCLASLPNPSPAMQCAAPHGVVFSWEKELYSLNSNVLFLICRS